jgi:hypothetical protein
MAAENDELTGITPVGILGSWPEPQGSDRAG